MIIDLAATTPLLALTTLGTTGLVLGILAILIGVWVAALPWIVRPFMRAVLWLRYDIRRIGLENFPRTGAVLVASNHMSWFDGFFLGSSIPRRATALVNAGVFHWPVAGYLARRCGLIPVPFTGPKAQRAAIEVCRKALDDGKVLGIFPEAQLTRNGLTGPFHRGLELILSKKENVPVIPVYLDNVWGSIMSYSDARFVWKRPRGWRRTIIVAFGPPVAPPVTAFTVRQAVLERGVTARAHLGTPKDPLEMLDPTLPHFNHPKWGPLTGSTADVTLDDVKQPGNKAGTIGLTLPGVAIRAVDETGAMLPADKDGSLQALLVGQPDWVDLECRGRVDREGFIVVESA